MHPTVIIKKDVTNLDKILKPGGLLQAVHTSVFKDIIHDDLRLWCHNNGVYGIPTIAAIALIKELFLGRTIEIGAGNGVFGREFDIPSTDSYIQDDPTMKLLYASIGQPTVEYGANVERIDALDAVAKYKPNTVFASWVTQIVREDESPDTPGCMHGVDELEMIKHIDRYVIFGNERVHADKKLFKLPDVNVTVHSSQHFISRAQYPALNRVWVVERKR